MIDFFIFLLLFFLVMIVFGSAAIAGLSAAPYVPTQGKDVKRILQIAGLKPNQLVYDLGCGDGRFLVAAAKHFKAKAIGIEMSVLPYLISRLKIQFLGLNNKVKIKFADFYKVDLKKADVIVCFLTPQAMKKLSPKFKKELKSGAKIVSYAFPMKDWKPHLKDKPHKRAVSVYLYQN
ncbi:class I SAM-dependent methyltransferase [Patescibacteria group bacterium]|nr:class I SAM-dependent methyltransferase [Patescibacteria group bacterium]